MSIYNPQSSAAEQFISHEEILATMEYARERITVWLDPAAYPLEGGWQTLQGMMAIGSGGFFGLGLGKSRLKYSWVSEPANDFIFTITCEELSRL